MKYFIGTVTLIVSTQISAFAMPVGTAMPAREAAVTQARVVIPPGRNANIIQVGGHAAAPDAHVVPPYAVTLSPGVLTTPSATSRSSSASTAAPQAHVVPPGALKLAPLLQ
ncbi:MAG TPA: hypothetical protein VM689_17420 [Aliidongia sp.]|nr:hypothetical protein [Aliidongia sp.]